MQFSHSDTSASSTCNGIQVHAEDVAVGDEVLHLLQLVGVFGMRDAFSELALAPIQVLLRELVDGFVEEGGGTHRRLADGEVQDPARRHVVGDQLLQAYFTTQRVRLSGV